MFYVYIITNEEEMYIGFTTDIDNRISEHNAGKNFSTKGSSNWKLLYYEAHTDKTDAHRRERYLKTTQGRRAIKAMLVNAITLKNF
jgi:putative endonuclease